MSVAKKQNDNDDTALQGRLTVLC